MSASLRSLLDFAPQRIVAMCNGSVAPDRRPRDSRHVRFSPIAPKFVAHGETSLSAQKQTHALQQKHRYSITSSARC
jgi:hypothetical protein